VRKTAQRLPDTIREAVELAKSLLAVLSRMKLEADDLEKLHTLNELMKENARLREELERVRRERNALAVRCGELEKSVAALRQRVSRLEEELARERELRKREVKRLSEPRLGDRLIEFLKEHGCGDDLWVMLLRHDPVLFDRLYEVVYGWVGDLEKGKKRGGWRASTGGDTRTSRCASSSESSAGS